LRDATAAGLPMEAFTLRFATDRDLRDCLDDVASSLPTGDFGDETPCTASLAVCNALYGTLLAFTVGACFTLTPFMSHVAT